MYTNVRLPTCWKCPPLQPAPQTRAHQLLKILRQQRVGYHFVEALALYDCLCRSRHGVTKNWADLTPVQQDDLDSRLLARVLKQQGMTATEAAKVEWRMLRGQGGF